MCGLLGIVHKNDDVYSSIYQGLEYLQYRGYDSCGISIVNTGQFEVEKQVGYLGNLKNNGASGKIGIGHTRWATHGCVSVKNAHPFVKDNIAIVHNGIVENYHEIQEKYPEFSWKTESDTESILNLVLHYDKEYFALNKCNIAHKADYEIVIEDNKCDPEQKWRYIFKKIFEELKGSFAIAITDLYDPTKIFFARKGLSPLSIAVNKDVAAVASDCIAMSKFADQVIDVQDGQYGHVGVNEYKLYVGEALERRSIINVPDINDKKRDTWFEEEFYSQGIVLPNAMNKLQNNISWPQHKPKMIELLGCGSSGFAGEVGKYWIEKYAGIFCRVSNPSEWHNVAGYDKTLALISQSGETADTLSIFQHMKNASADQKSTKIKTVGFINTLGSTMSRMVDDVVPTFVGQEVSVASTKAMTGQMLSLFLWAHKLADREVGDLENRLFSKISDVICDIERNAKDASDICANVQNIFILAKGNLIPVAFEGALKIKELTYLHAEGFYGNDLKHGPLAMINGEKDSSQVVIFLAPSSSSKWTKILAAIEEVQSRGGKVIVVSDRPEHFKNVQSCIKVPYIEEDLAPFIYTLVMQWLAFVTAVRMGNSIDRPRNLAKSVTVE